MKAARLPVPVPVPDPPVPDNLLTISELADRLHLSRDAVERLLPLGLPYLDVSGPRSSLAERTYHSRRFDFGAVLKFLSERSGKKSA